MGSAISDIEVEHLQLEKRTALSVPGYERTVEFGVLYDIAYRTAEGGGKKEEVVVSTTRPETLLGDVAVAVHPEDPRHRRLVGRRLRHPLRPGGDAIPVVADDFVDRDLGTGAVKVTPAHSAADLEVGRRHRLASIKVIDEAGNICLPGSPFHVSGFFPSGLIKEKKER